MTRNVAYLLRGVSSIVLTGLLATSLAPMALAVDGAEIDRQVAEKQAEADQIQQRVNEKIATSYELQMQIEEKQAAYAAALEEVDATNASIEENEQRIADLEREIPQQEKRSNEAAREMYKFQQESLDIIDLLLSSTSFQDFIAQLEYVNRVTQSQVDEITRLNAMKAEVDQKQIELNSLKTEVEMRSENARVALMEAQDAQAEIQQRIADESRMIAEIAAMAEELAKQPRDNDQGSIGSVEPTAVPDAGAPSAEPANGEAVQEEGAAAAAEAGSPEPAATPSAPAASGGENDFVTEWTARIDAYLAGSPLAGQGATFARAAYEYGVDPRFSPAISFTESGKGAYCFLSHNAWGWGSASWGSWEEAIYDHVAGLARGYGGQISVEGAKKYCPPNWQLWYDRTLGQMQLI